jgi:hypothetical protein
MIASANEDSQRWNLPALFVGLHDLSFEDDFDDQVGHNKQTRESGHSQ